MNFQAKWLMALGTALMVAGCFLPWLSRNGQNVAGVEVTSFGYPAIVIMSCALVAGIGSLGLRIFKNLQPYLLTIILLMVISNLWRAFRLGAMGWGLAVVGLGMILAFWAYYRSRRD